MDMEIFLHWWNIYEHIYESAYETENTLVVKLQKM